MISEWPGDAAGCSPRLSAGRRQAASRRRARDCSQAITQKNFGFPLGPCECSRSTGTSSDSYSSGRTDTTKLSSSSMNVGGMNVGLGGGEGCMSPDRDMVKSSSIGPRESRMCGERRGASKCSDAVRARAERESAGAARREGLYRLADCSRGLWPGYYFRRTDQPLRRTMERNRGGVSK